MKEGCYNEYMNVFTGKSVSEALIFESVNPQYDERLFIESPEKYKFRTCCVQILFWNKKKFCTQYVLNLYVLGGIQWTISCHIYCGLTDARIRASKKDLLVQQSESI